MENPPPTYEEASLAGRTPGNQNIVSQDTNHPSTNPPTNHPPAPHQTRNGISPQSRRSMEDETRPLPRGWVRQYDAKEHHQFFVDTTTDPPRSIWHHPYDDDQYMSTLPPEERANIRGLHRVPTEADIAAESSDDDHDSHQLPPRPEPVSGIHRFGRRMKDKITNSTHEEREKMRAQRAEEERIAYERHQKYRAAMAKAMETGEPQLIGKDREGKDVYIEPPPPQMGFGGGGYGMGGGGFGMGGGGYGMGGYGQGSYGMGGGYGREGYGQDGYGYSPYTEGPYSNPNARFIRPSAPYSRPYYGGYGGGLGLPIGLGLGGGLLGAGLLGGF